MPANDPPAPPQPQQEPREQPLEERLVDLEMKLAWQDKQLADLNAALVDKERRVSALEERNERLERALQILAARTPRGSDDVAGALDVDDPVPRSG